MTRHQTKSIKRRRFRRWQRFPTGRPVPVGRITARSWHHPNPLLRTAALNRRRGRPEDRMRHAAAMGPM